MPLSVVERVQISPTTLFFIEGCGQLGYSMCWGECIPCAFCMNLLEPVLQLWQYKAEALHDAVDRSESCPGISKHCKRYLLIRPPCSQVMVS